MSEIEMLTLGAGIGASSAAFAYVGYLIVKTEVERYVDGQVREAKKELREWVRERES